MGTELDTSKKTKMLIGQDGHLLLVREDGSINVNVVIDVGSQTPLDIKPPQRVPLDSIYTEIVKYQIPVGKQFNILKIIMTVGGFASHFIMEHFDGTDTHTLRECWPNLQKPDYLETGGIPLSVQHTTGAYVRIIGKMEGVNQTGFGYAIINGYLEGI